MHTLNPHMSKGKNLWEEVSKQVLSKNKSEILALTLFFKQSHSSAPTQ